MSRPSGTHEQITLGEGPEPQPSFGFGGGGGGGLGGGGGAGTGAGRGRFKIKSIIPSALQRQSAELTCCTLKQCVRIGQKRFALT